MEKYGKETWKSSWKFLLILQIMHGIDSYSAGSKYHLRTTVPFVTAHLEIFHCTHHPVIPKYDLYFTFCSTLNALSKRTSK